MTEKSEALQLADFLDDQYDPSHNLEEAAAELRRLHDLVDACEPYLKEGETPAERIERERGDTEAVCRLYAKEREKNIELLEALRTAVDHLEGMPDQEDVAACVVKARAAIAKAEGEAK